MTTSMILLRLAAIGWGILCGGMVYEHVAVVPQWAKQPPASLAMWSGPFRVRAERFWMSAHPPLVLLLGGALAMGWDGGARVGLSIVLGTYLAILVMTAAWFVPELLKLTQDPAAAIPHDEWLKRSRRWERLSLARGAVLLALFWPLLGALSQ
jgi:hypothetical protein